MESLGPMTSLRKSTKSRGDPHEILKGCLNHAFLCIELEGLAEPDQQFYEILRKSMKSLGVTVESLRKSTKSLRDPPEILKEIYEILKGLPRTP